MLEQKEIVLEEGPEEGGVARARVGQRELLGDINCCLMY